MQEIADGVFSEIKYYGCNVSCVKTDDGVLLVDNPQNPSDALDWRAQAEKIGPIRYQVNSEHHADHIMGNWFFRDATFVAHEGTLERFHETVGDTPEGWLDRIEPLDPEGVAQARADGFDFRKPDVLFNDRMTLYLGGREIELIHKVGHTENQAMVYLADAKVLLPGDNVVEDWPPLLHSGVADAWLETLDFIEGLDVKVITPGHGEISDKSILPVLRDSIKDLVAMVQGAIDEGKTKEQAQEMKDYVLKWDPIVKKAPDFYQILGGKGIGRIYDVLNPPPEEVKPKKKRKKYVNKGE
jgi:glyoxylase-like metal-dependent hydrolase (beta-lactamase superfamily II)